MNKEYNCVEVKLKNKDGEEFKALYDKSRQLLFMSDYTMGGAFMRRAQLPFSARLK